MDVVELETDEDVVVDDDDDVGENQFVAAQVLLVTRKESDWIVIDWNP